MCVLIISITLSKGVCLLKFLRTSVELADFTVLTYAYITIYTQTCTHIPMYLYVHAHIYTDVCILNYTDMHTHAYTDTHTCAHIHTYMVILYFVTTWIIPPVTLTDITPDDGTGIKLVLK